MARKRHSSSSVADINMTPMIDCTFQLIIFFVLTAQMVSADLAKLKPASPINSMATTEEAIQDIPNKVIVNVINEYLDQDDDPEKNFRRDPFRSDDALAYKIGSWSIWVKSPPPRLRSMMKPDEKVDLDPETTLAEALKLRKDASDAEGHEEFFVEIRADKDIRFSDIKVVIDAAVQARIGKMSITAIVDEDMNIKKN